MRIRLAPLSIGALAAFNCLAGAATLAPDDPSVSASLGLWLTDARNNFDGSTWNDSSGNGNHAVPVGTVGAGPTYVAPSLDLVTTTIDHNTSSVAFSGSADDLIRASGVNGGTGTNQVTIFAAYVVEAFGGNPNLTRPAGFGSIAGTQLNPGDHLNLASDPSVRKDNGQIGSGNYSEAFPLGSSFVRVARMDAAGIDEWFNSSISLNSVLTDFGAQYTTSNDDFYLGDLRAGPTAVLGSTSTSDFSISQIIVYNSALTDEQIAGINEWMLTPIPEPGSTALLGLATLGLLRRRR
ncbi:MAG: PEP-CTERM sorting domain-containing protein [Verrucomicrobiales bacterium]